MATESTALAVSPAVSSEELELVRRTVANGATDAELKLFLFDCKRRGIHPLDKLLHFTKRAGKYTPVTSIDFMRAQAAATGEMAGSDEPIFENGEKQPTAATVTVYRLTQGQRFAYTATARWSEYCPENAPMWRKMPHTMLGKCAEALALRKAFPQQLAGLYAREEMDQAGPSGYSVEAPAPARGASVPPTQSGGDSEGRPSGAEVPGDAALSPGSSITQHGEEIPEDGLLYVTRVDASPTKNKTVTKYLITFSNGEQASTIKPMLASLAEQMCQECAPCAYESKETKWGADLTDLKRAPKTPPPPMEEPAPMLTAEDIPF